MTEPYIQTVSGRKFYPLDPDPYAVCIEDIAYALAGEYRFGGHCKPRVTVAEHSIAVSRAVPREYALWGLLHDGSEAYLRDISRPVKMDTRLAEYRYAEHGVMAAITVAFGLPYSMPECVRVADLRACGSEARACMSPGCYDWKDLAPPLADYEVRGYPPDLAEFYFLERYKELSR